MLGYTKFSPTSKIFVDIPMDFAVPGNIFGRREGFRACPAKIEVACSRGCFGGEESEFEVKNDEK